MTDHSLDILAPACSDALAQWMRQLSFEPRQNPGVIVSPPLMLAEVSAWMTLTAKDAYTLVLSADAQVAYAAVDAMLADAKDIEDQDIPDGVSEILNTIAGIAKNKLHAQGYLYQKSVPVALTGTQQQLHPRTLSPVAYTKTYLAAGCIHLWIWQHTSVREHS